MEKEHLHLLIDEEIYLIEGESDAGKGTSDSGGAVSDEGHEVKDGGSEAENSESKVSESLEKGTSEKQQDQRDVDGKELQGTSDEAQTEVVKTEVAEETPSNENSTNTESEPQKEEGASVKYAFFHNTDQPTELDLLNKIISACKLSTDDFKVLKVGQDIIFEKAVVFTKSGPSYYLPTKHERGIVMYAQPLAVLMASKEEKAKLWGALQQFVK